MDDTDIAKSLGRIEQKIDGFKEEVIGKFARLDSSLFEKGGHEPRIRDLEQDVVAMKVKAGMVATVISFAVTALFSVVAWLLKK